MSKTPDPSESKRQRRPSPKTYSPEFRASTARLVLEEGRSRAQVARDLGLSGSMVARWIAEVQRGGPQPPSALSGAEREELDRLRRENRVLKMEREILKKAAAFFAKENA